MFRRCLTVFLLIAGLAAPVWSQSAGGNVVIGSDLRLFTMLAALNAAGFDVELGSQYHPVRAEVRKSIKIDPALTQRLRDFYTSHKGKETDEAQLAKYIALALMLTDAPELKPAFREEFLPPDARSVLGFSDLLREFYQQANISQLWSRVSAEYDKEIDAMAPQIRNTLLQTDAYLRLVLGATGTRSMSIYVELTAPVNSANVRSNQDNYYVVFGSSATPRLDDLRHAYLHFQLDNVIVRDQSKIQNRASLLALITGEEGVQPEFTSDFRFMVTESLIRALELRMDRKAAAVAKQEIDSYYRTGLLLTPYFYEALMNYNEQGEGIRDYFRDMAESVDLTTERDRFRTTFHTIPLPLKPSLQAEVPQPPPVPAANPVMDLLKEAEAAFNSGDNAKARTSFETVLSNYDRANGAAFYGLALIASREGASEEAEQYFERTTRSASADASMKVWAYIYLARLFDLRCERPRAIEYYEQAVKVGDNSRNAQTVAKDGLTKPYGDVCR